MEPNEIKVEVGIPARGCNTDESGCGSGQKSTCKPAGYYVTFCTRILKKDLFNNQNSKIYLCPKIVLML
jgi:hypothetical protein